MIVDTLRNAGLYYGISEKIETALKYLRETDLTNLENGKYEIDGDNIFIIIQEYVTKPENEGKWEAHKKYIDIQYIIKGQEKLGYTNIQETKPLTEYDTEKDIIFLEGNGSFITAKENDFLIFAPEDAHMPGIATGELSQVKKVVIKIKA